MSVVLRNTFTSITTAPEEARCCPRDNDSKTVISRMPNPFVASLLYFFPIFFSIFLPSPGSLLPVTKGSPLLCSGCLPRWFARCSGRICIGWPTCCFPPPLSPTRLYLLFSLPSFLLSFTWDRSHPLWLTLSLSSHPLFLSPPCLLLCPASTPHLAPSSLYLIVFSSFFSLAFLSLSVLKSISILFCGVIQSVISLQPVWVNRQGFSSPRTLEQEKNRHEKSLRNAGSKLKDGERARVGMKICCWTVRECFCR